MNLTVGNLLDHFKEFKLLTDGNYSDRPIEVSELSRPGLELTGYVEYYPYKRVQIFGRNEVSYLETIKYPKSTLKQIIREEVPIMIFCRNQRPSDEFIKRANEVGVPVCITKSVTSKVTSQIFSFLEYELAPQTQIHGVLLSVFGKGVLIRGQSGVGKSEVALELINRGHILVADDAVVIRQIDENTLIGAAPALLKNRLEIRGVGIVNVQQLYGVTKVVQSKSISLVIELKPLTGSEDRIGNNMKYDRILECDIPKIEIPITVGRSVSNLIEVAVANFELKTEYNIDSAQNFIDDLYQMLGE